MTKWLGSAKCKFSHFSQSFILSTPIRKIITSLGVIFFTIVFQFPQLAVASNAAYANDLAQGSNKFDIDYNIYRNRETLAEARRLMKLKQEDKRAAQEQAELEAQAEERKAARLAQATRGELRDLSEDEYVVKKTYVANISAYSSSPDECSGNPFITASGAHVHPGTIAVPRNIPFGTMFRIPDLDPDQIYIAEDRGGAIKGNKIDVWVGSKAEAFKIGRVNLNVQIIEFK